MSNIPVTVDFDDQHVIGYVQLTKDGKKLYEEMIESAGLHSKHVPVLSPGYIHEFADQNGVIKNVELLELSLIPASRVIPREQDGN